MDSRLRTLRLGLLVVVLALAAPATADFVTTDGTTPPATQSAIDTPGTAANGTSGNGTALLDRPRGHLVYTIDATGPGQLTVYNRTSKELIYHAEDYQLYHDVDPSPAGRYTVTYVASNIVGDADCPPDIPGTCTRDVIERLNYSTGERERLYSRLVNYNGSSNTHDVDRIGKHRFLVGDIQFDRAYVVNVETDEIEWTWNASSEFNRSSGGRPDDWTHLNDVGKVGDGRYMINLRNQDQTVFVDREEGLLENMTLGSDDDHSTLYEQHNPDYIPESRGGPALLVADSENNRIVEYQYRDGSWNRSWLWTDERVQWPRDADRLPNNNTLVTDTHGTRILEVAPNGTVVWTHLVPRGTYDAELLATGDESATGRSMAAIRGNLTEAKTDVSSVDGVGASLQRSFLELFPPLVLHGFLFVLPSWVSPLSGGLLLLATVLAGLWVLGEIGRYGREWYRN